MTKVRMALMEGKLRAVGDAMMGGREEEERERGTEREGDTEREVRLMAWGGREGEEEEEVVAQTRQLVREAL